MNKQIRFMIVSATFIIIAVALVLIRFIIPPNKAISIVAIFCILIALAFLVAALRANRSRNS